MNNAARTLARACAGLVPLAAYRAFTGRRCAAFCYHSVCDEPRAYNRYYNCKTPREFERDLLFLKKNFELVSYKEFIAHYGSRRSKKRAGLLTFDDGLRECFSIVRPLLLKHGVPCVFFVATDYVGNTALLPEQKASLCISALERMDEAAAAALLKKLTAVGGALNRTAALRLLGDFPSLSNDVIDRFCAGLELDLDAVLAKERPFLTAEEITVMAHEGFAIGAHGTDHTRLDKLSEAAGLNQLRESAERIMKLTGCGSAPFAFPHNGGYVHPSFIARIRSECPAIDAIFDTRSLREDMPGVINRIWTDELSLQRALKLAYADYLVNHFSSGSQKGV